MTTDFKIAFDKDFSDKVSDYRTLLIEADVENRETTDAQKSEMNKLCDEFAAKYKVEDINRLPGIAETRSAYKLCGKDPNRYRPSQEQMMRRIVRGLGLYNVNALVDAGNMLSLITGCSVGCFDADKIKGKVLTLGVGKDGEPYEGIGRGELNIAGLPVFRDEVGGVGTPTSDNERTKLESSTKRLVVTVHLFRKEITVDEVMNLFVEIFGKFGNATNIRHSVFIPL